MDLKGYVLPPMRMCTLIFLRDVLAGRRKLLRSMDAKMVPYVPRLPEIDLTLLWREIKCDIVFNAYFPFVYMNETNVPDRSYFFMVR